MASSRPPRGLRKSSQQAQLHAAVVCPERRADLLLSSSCLCFFRRTPPPNCSSEISNLLRRYVRVPATTVAALARVRSHALEAYTDPATTSVRHVAGEDAAARCGDPIRRSGLAAAPVYFIQAPFGRHRGAGLLHPRAAWPARVWCALRVSLCAEPVSSNLTSSLRRAVPRNAWVRVRPPTCPRPPR